MRWLWLIAALLAVLSLGMAALAHQRCQALMGEALLEEQRSTSSGREFVETFSGGFVDDQLQELDQKRACLLRAAEWREAMLLSLVGLIFFGFSGYVLASMRGVESRPTVLGEQCGTSSK